MSSLFNQTNIAPGTAFSGGGGGGSNFPQGLTVGDAVLNPLGSQVINLQTQLRVGLGIGSQNAILTSGALYFQQTGTGVTIPFLAYDGSSNYSLQNVDTANITNTNAIKLNNVSTLTAGANNANMIALMSSLKTAYPSNFF